MYKRQAWYGQLDLHLGKGFEFDRRVHPRASDPVNLLLNLGYTILHRMMILALTREGFATSIGVMHASGRRHAALASDLQEPFRHLIDRVVIDATHQLRVNDFRETYDGPFPLRIDPVAYRTFSAMVFRAFTLQCHNIGQQSSKSYRQHLVTCARSLRRHLLNRDAKFKVFQHQHQ